MDAAIDTMVTRRRPGRYRSAPSTTVIPLRRPMVVPVRRRRLLRLPKVLNAGAASCGAPVSVEGDWATTCELTIGHHGSHRHGEATPSVWRGRLAVLRS